MKVKVEMEINNCYACPFKERVYEQGFCGEVCGRSKKAYATIPKKGIAKDCPLRQFEIKNMEEEKEK